MPLDIHSRISVECCVQIASTTAMRYEVDQLNELAMLYFGYHNEYMLTLSKDNLLTFLDLGNRAVDELSMASGPEDALRDTANT